MRENYKNKNGTYGYGHAKQTLFELITGQFAEVREKYNYYMAHPDVVETLLNQGADKAKLVAEQVLNRVRLKLGFN
jgi:tryptophanyl-tRNA synthetase